MVIARILALCLMFAAVPGFAAPARDSVMAKMGARLFPVLTSLDPATAPAPVRTALSERAKRMAACGADAGCKVSAAEWSPAEIALMAEKAAPMLARKAKAPVDQAEAPAAMRRELEGLNAILRIYGKGATPRYPEIDGPATRPGDKRFEMELAAAAAMAEASRNDPVTAMDAGTGLALALLDANDRLDAVGFEPVEGGLNAAPFARAKTLDWSRYPYTAMIVLGVGPDDLVTRLSALGKLNVRTAANRYFEGAAPFIIVSGGKAHPRSTPFAEAVEMRRALIERYGVPADAIVIEPYARHTTTNLRNASRLLMAMQAPLDRDTIVITNPVHSASVASPQFVARNQRELGYQPGTVGARNSPFEVRFRPSALSARIDPLDPLDP